MKKVNCFLLFVASLLLASCGDNEINHYIPIPSDLTYSLGDTCQGGTVIFLDAERKHGLIVSDKDMIGDDRTLFVWGPLEATGVSDSIGETNTIILAGKATLESEMGYWFKSHYSYNGYTDWYIPSISELKILKENKQYLKNIKKHYYWSSSEMKGEYVDNAYIMDFVSDDTRMMGQKKDVENMVRLIRKF